jgi:hypothetical protein
MEGFFESGEKLEIYNRTFDVMNAVKDEGLRARMSETFHQFKKLNRQFDKLVREAEDLQLQRCREALETVVIGFEARRVERIGKDILMATAEILLEQNVV